MGHWTYSALVKLFTGQNLQYTLHMANCALAKTTILLLQNFSPKLLSFSLKYKKKKIVMLVNLRNRLITEIFYIIDQLDYISLFVCGSVSQMLE